jgi:membrane dipeptidase
MPTRREFVAGTTFSALAIAAHAAQSACAAESDASGVTPALLKRAQGLLDKAPLIDTHNDLPSMLLEEGVAGDLGKFDLNARQPKLCADIPSLREGRVGAQYWSIFVEAATMKTHVSLHEAMREFDVALRMIAQYGDFEQARTADDIERIRKAGKIACLMGVEGGHMIENSPAVLRVFHALGARYLTLTHWDNLEWADSATDRGEHFGLTDAGKQLVREMNRLGMFADLSHVSADTMRDTLKVTRAPVIFSHSNAYALNPHPRNVPDDVLGMLKTNGGVVHVNFIRPFVARNGNDFVQGRDTAARELHAQGADDDGVKKGVERWTKEHLPKVGIAEVADHIDHIRKVAGIDHIGVGADYYDTDEATMVDGLANVTRYPYLFAELLRRGYTDDDVLKIAGRNHLRAMRRMEQVAADLRRTESPLLTEPSRPAWP